MKAFLASLLAACAFAEVYQLINEESEMLSFEWDWGEPVYTPYENAGEFLSLEITEVEAGMEFCLTVEAPGAAVEYYSYFGIEWTNGPVTSL